MIMFHKRKFNFGEKEMKIAFRVIIAASLFALAACSGTTGGMKQTAGTVLGGVGGAALGSQFGKGTGQLVGVAAGALLGGFIGSEVGSSLDKADQNAASAAQSRSYNSPVGTSSSWSGSNAYGSSTPTREYKSVTGQTCREIENTFVTEGGQLATANGTVCKDKNGNWVMID